jgi:hypothetical protein
VTIEVVDERFEMRNSVLQGALGVFQSGLFHDHLPIAS